jgi:hypothetical protein
MGRKVLKIPLTRHPDYFNLASNNWRRIQELKQEHDELQSKLGRDRKSDDRITDQLAAKNDAIDELALVVIIFCAFALEAYINDYAIKRLSEKYLKTNVDKLDLFAKWVVIPRLVTGKQLDSGSRPLQDLKWLVRLRNRLAHYKSEELTIEQIKVSDFLWYEDAKRAIATVKGVITALKEIDPKVDADWIENQSLTSDSSR